MKVICIAYACEPGKGSEPGAGWNFAHLLAGLAETWVVTRANNREPIEAAMASEPGRPRPKFVYVDLPERARFWKRGGRGVRLYYLLWQRAALHRIRTLDRQEHFDVAWHLTMANAWLGSVGALVNLPFVYGPVGGGIGVSWRLLPSLGGRGMVYEVARWAVRSTARVVNPLARLSWRRAHVILAQNAETRDWFPRQYRSKVRIHTNAVVDPLPRFVRDDHRPHTAVFAGRLLPFKGVHLAIEAISRLPEWRLVVMGDGPDRRRLETLTEGLGVEQRVQFRGWVPRHVLLEALQREADVFLFPCLHEEGGLAVAESFAAGVPVVSLAIGGPVALGEPGVAIGGRAVTVARLADRLARIADLRVPDPPTFAAHRERLAAILASVRPRSRDRSRLSGRT